MADNLKELLRQRDEFEDYEYTEADYAKITGDPFFGCMVKVYFPDEGFDDIIDVGYCFALPECDSDPWMYDFFVHIPQQSNPSGKENGEPIWAHMGAIVTNEKVSKIEFV